MYSVPQCGTLSVMGTELHPSPHLDPCTCLVNETLSAIFWAGSGKCRPLSPRYFPRQQSRVFASPWKLFTSPELSSFSHKVMLGKSLLFSRMSIFFSWEQLCKVYCRFYKNSGSGSETFLCPSRTKIAWNLITSMSLCAGVTPNMFRIWTDVNRKMEMVGW